MWLGALATVVAIYSTLGLAGRLAAFLGERGILEPSFGLGFLLVIAAIAGSALRRRPGRHEAWMMVGMKIEGKVVLVTGAASGIGRALAHALHREGAAAVAWRRSASSS